MIYKLNSHFSLGAITRLSVPNSKHTEACGEGCTRQLKKTTIFADQIAATQSKCTNVTLRFSATTDPATDCSKRRTWYQQVQRSVSALDSVIKMRFHAV